MRLLVWMFAGAVSFAVGWSGTRWIAQPAPVLKQTVSTVEEESVALDSSASSKPQTPGDATEERMEALAALCEQPDSLTRDHALVGALLKLEAADFPAGTDEMLALLKRLKGTVKSADLADAWMDRWLDLDAPGALQFLSTSSFLAEIPTPVDLGWPLETLAEGGLGGVFRALARREPEWTRQTLANMEPGKRREVAIYTLLREVAQGGVEKAAGFLATLGDGPDRRGAVTGYVTGLITTDLRSGFERAWTESPGPLRDDLLRRVFCRAGESGLAVMGELLDRVDDPAVRWESIAWGLRAVTSEDPVPLIKQESDRMAAAGEWNVDTSTWMSTVDVASRSPRARALAEWAVDFAPDGERKMFARIAENWAGRNPVEFKEWLSERAATLDASTAEKLAQPLAALAQRDLVAARAWSDALPPGPLRDQARFQVALRGDDGDLAYAEAAYQPLAAGDAKGTLAGQLARVLAGKDSAAAAEWATGQPLSAARIAAIRQVAETWSGRDPHGAAQWLGQMPIGTERDTAVGSYASAVVRADPEGAAQWAEQVADPVQRTKTAVEVYYFWSKENPAAARTWFRSLSRVDEDTIPDFLRHIR